MRFALIGNKISHSLSPKLYQKIIADDINYDLLDYSAIDNLPKLRELAANYVGLNITSPFKSHYLSEVIIDDQVVKSLGAINTISLTTEGYFATNTDLFAIRHILSRFKKEYPSLKIILLGNGVMAKVTFQVASELSVPVNQLFRKTHPDLHRTDLRPFESRDEQVLVINACSRQFTFQGQITNDFIFWDYNYNFYPHQNTLPFQVKEYHDGQEMLFLQANEAWKFWQATNTKLKC